MGIGDIAFCWIRFFYLCFKHYDVSIRPVLILWVVDRPDISSPPANRLCQGSQMQLQSDTSGVWRSLNPSIATIDSISGIVSGISSGMPGFTSSHHIRCADLILQHLYWYWQPPI